MNLKFYAGLKVVLEGHPNAHITTAYSDVVTNVDTGEFPASGEALVLDVEYWEEPDVTVLTVECRRAVKIHNKFRKMGFNWDYPDYKPHITVGKGNHVDKNQYLIGQYIPIAYEYRKIIVQEK